MAQLLSAVAPGTLVKLNENGSPVEFYVGAQNYESGLNGPGRTLLVRKDVYQNGAWNASNVNAYANGIMDQWLNTSYKGRLDAWAQSEIGATTFYYTPGNGNTAVTTLARAVFALSARELRFSGTGINTEGSGLDTASVLKTVYANGVAAYQWTRSPRTDGNEYAWRVGPDGNIGVSPAAYNINYFRPCFTLPGTLYVWDDGTVSQIPGPGPATITTPALIMTGNSVPISWDGVDGADSYILQRKADGGEWTQVYAGSGTTFTDTAGSWSTVQYQVCGVFGGTNGAFAQSDVISVAPASTLVISGQDGSLGTLTADIPYSVATDTGNQIALTRTVNGSLVASLTVNSGFAYDIPVMDLPTGTGTIVITATVQTSSYPVTVTRTWTYTKQAQTFPTSGGLAQLTQDGQNVFPLTLAEAVKAIGGPWGGNLSTALDKLAMAAVFNREVTPKYTAVTVDLSKVQPGDIVNLPENGVMVPFYVGSVDYEPTLNTSGTRVLLVRKDVYQNGQWNASRVNAYAGSTIDNWFNSTYKPMLDSTVQAQVGTTTFKYTPGNGNYTVTTLAKAVFALSMTELGFPNSSGLDFNVEGSALPIALKLAELNGVKDIQWSRSPYNSNASDVCGSSETGVASGLVATGRYGYRPCFTLPATFQATYYVDPNSGTVYPSQEYTTAGDFADLWGNIIPTVKTETGSYTGTGTYGIENPNTLTFGFEPKLVLITTQESTLLSGNFFRAILFSGLTSGVSESSATAAPFFAVLTVQWEGNTVSWYNNSGAGTGPNMQLNSNTRVYNYIAIG